MKDDHRQQPLVIIGPSGAGKSTIIRMLTRDNILCVQPTWTTRPQRLDEEHDTIEHRFVSDSKFEAMKQRGEFLRTVQMFGLPYKYGLPRLSFNETCITAVILRASLVELFTKYYPSRIVYQIYDTRERIAGRLMQREALGERSGDRHDEYDREVLMGKQLSTRSFLNTDLETTCTEVQRAINKDFNLDHF